MIESIKRVNEYYTKNKNKHTGINKRPIFIFYTSDINKSNYWLSIIIFIKKL